MFTKLLLLLLFIVIFTIILGLRSFENLHAQAKLTFINGSAFPSVKEFIAPKLNSGLVNSHENITISKGTGLFQGTTDIKSLPSINYTQKKRTR